MHRKRTNSRAVGISGKMWTTVSRTCLRRSALIVAQTRSAGGSHADFVAGLDLRIDALARTHELLSQNNWRGVSLREIVRRECAPYTAGNADIGGPSVTLRAEAAKAVAMVLHELATNAAKYGAFSSRSGRVMLRWWWLQNGSHGRLAIEWQEIGGPRVLAPHRSGYGTVVIRELIPFELGGAADLVYAADGVRCRLEIPADWVGDASQSAEVPRRLHAAEAVSRN